MNSILADIIIVLSLVVVLRGLIIIDRVSSAAPEC